jgi:hypothetical protein
MLADNKIFGLGVDDLDTLDTFLAELKDDLDIPGFDEDLLRSMVSQADEISEKLQEYGTLDADEVEEIKAARERKDLYMSIKPDVCTENKPKEIAEEKPVGEERESVRQFVVCPRCGEKVWL